MFKFLDAFYKEYQHYIGSGHKEGPAHVQVDQESKKQSTI